MAKKNNAVKVTETVVSAADKATRGALYAKQYGSKDSVPADGFITVLVDKNPKHGKSAERFALYKSGMSIADALANGALRADLRWDAARGFIGISDKPANVVAPARKARK